MCFIIPVVEGGYCNNIEKLFSKNLMWNILVYVFRLFGFQYLFFFVIDNQGVYVCQYIVDAK